MRRGRGGGDEAEEEQQQQGPALTPVLHFCDEGQRIAFAMAMVIHERVVSEETLGAQGLSDTPGERDARIIIYKLSDEKNVVTVTQLPGRSERVDICDFCVFNSEKRRRLRRRRFSSYRSLREHEHVLAHVARPGIEDATSHDPGVS